MKERDFVAPQALELEEAVLGACLIERTALPQVDGMLKPEMFYDNRHQLIFAALQAMYRTGMNIDILTAAEELRRRGKLEAVGGAFYVTQLSSRVASSAHLDYHARIVHQKYIRREMIVGFNKLLAASYDETIDIDDTLVEAHNLTDRLEGQCGHDTRLRNMDTLMRDTLAQAAGRMERCREGITGIPTGLTDLDRMTAGWQNGDLTVIAARPSVGKTAFALHLALAAARAGHAVAVYSLEMQGERLGDRWLVSAGKTNAYLWKSGKLSAEEFAEAQQTSAELARLPIHVDDSSDMSIDKVRSSARLLKSRGQGKRLPHRGTGHCHRGEAPQRGNGQCLLRAQPHHDATGRLYPDTGMDEEKCKVTETLRDYLLSFLYNHFIYKFSLIALSALFKTLTHILLLQVSSPTWRFDFEYRLSSSSFNLGSLSFQVKIYMPVCKIEVLPSQRYGP